MSPSPLEFKYTYIFPVVEGGALLFLFLPTVVALVVFYIEAIFLKELSLLIHPQHPYPTRTQLGPPFLMLYSNRSLKGHYFLCCVLSRSVMSHYLWPHGLFVSPWGFSRHEYWSGLPCHPPGGLPNPGIKTRSPTLQADCLPSEPPGKPKNTEVNGLSLL